MASEISPLHAVLFFLSIVASIVAGLAKMGYFSNKVENISFQISVIGGLVSIPHLLIWVTSLPVVLFKTQSILGILQVVFYIFFLSAVSIVAWFVMVVINWRVLESITQKTVQSTKTVDDEYGDKHAKRILNEK